MLEVQKRKLDQAVSLLKLLNVDYKVITPCGIEYGDLEVKTSLPPSKARSLPRYGRLETRDVFLPYLNGMKIGEVKVIPCGKYDPRVISRDISAYCANQMGSGYVSVASNVEGKEVEVLAMQDLPCR